MQAPFDNRPGVFLLQRLFKRAAYRPRTHGKLGGQPKGGLRAAAFSDNHMQAITASHLTDRDVAIGISHSGSSKDIVDALKIARLRGATAISITNKGKSPITKVSDITLFTASNETKYTILGLNSRISQLSIISSIYYYIVYHREGISSEAIEMTETALQNKKY